jgi:hypothetical protein
MRENGVRSLSVTCESPCRHQAVMNVDTFDDAMPIPSFRAVPASGMTGCACSHVAALTADRYLLTPGVAAKRAAT